MAIADAAAVQVGTKTLGERVVEAARLAVAVHLFESRAAKSPNFGRQVLIGGAGPFAASTADRGHPRRPFRIPGDAGDECAGDEGTRHERAGDAGADSR